MRIVSLLRAYPNGQDPPLRSGEKSHGLRCGNPTFCLTLSLNLLSQPVAGKRQENNNVFLELLFLFRYNGAKERNEAMKKEKYLYQRQQMAPMSVEERREFSRKGGKATQLKKRAGPSLYTTISTEGDYYIHIMPSIFTKPVCTVLSNENGTRSECAKCPTNE